MRQRRHTIEDERHLFLRSIALDYSAGATEAAHSHSWPQLLYACQGAIRVQADGNYWTVPPRRALWMPAATPHRLHISSRLQLRTLYLREDVPGLPQKPGLAEVTGLLHEAILRICELGSLDDRIEADRHMGALVVGELQSGLTDQIFLKLPRDLRAARLADFFCDPEKTHVPIEALCRNAGLSRRTAERVFEKECGMPPAQWRRLAALSASLLSLANGESIETAALAAGYESRSAFAESFRRAFGFPPGHVRRSGLPRA